MHTDLSLEKLHVIKNMLDSYVVKNEILSFFEKKCHISKVKDYKPGSDKHIKAIAEDLRIAALPDYDVKLSDKKSLRFDNNCGHVELSIGTIIIVKPVYNDEYEDYIEQTITYTFMYDNEYHPTHIVCSLDDLLSLPIVQLSLCDNSKTVQKRKWIDILKDSRLGDGLYMLLLDRIIKADDLCLPVTFYTDRITIGEETFTKEEMILIKNAYDSKESVYNDRDELEVYRDYMYGDYINYYNKFIKKGV